MEQYISKDRLAEFIARMWDEGIDVDVRPGKKVVELWSGDYKTHVVINVGITSFEDTVADVISNFKEA